MTETEKKALALVRELTGKNIDSLLDDATFWDVIGALYRAIEQHEAYKQNVSETLRYVATIPFNETIRRDAMLAKFIIPKTDPLVEALKDCGFDQNYMVVANNLNAALAARGLEIREKQP